MCIFLNKILYCIDILYEIYNLFQYKKKIEQYVFFKNKITIVFSLGFYQGRGAKIIPSFFILDVTISEYLRQHIIIFNIKLNIISNEGKIRMTEKYTAFKNPVKRIVLPEIPNPTRHIFFNFAFVGFIFCIFKLRCITYYQCDESCLL